MPASIILKGRKKMRLLLKNCKLLSNGLPVVRDIYIANGIIKKIGNFDVSADKTIDYSGHLLNLTSRLTGLARPSGIIIDGNFGINLLDKEIRGNFQEQHVYLDGIAENEPIKIYFTEKSTVIPKRNIEPILAERWRHLKDTRSLRVILKCDKWFQ